MCKCNPNIRTPFCGKPDCEWPTLIPQIEYERRLNFARQEAAKAWAKVKTVHILDQLLSSGTIKFITTRDVALLNEFAVILVKHIYAPHLGLATTGEMLDEIKARVDCNYKTNQGVI